jgi:hypothetical protein
MRRRARNVNGPVQLLAYCNLVDFTTLAHMRAQTRHVLHNSTAPVKKHVPCGQDCPRPEIVFLRLPISRAWGLVLYFSFLLTEFFENFLRLISHAGSALVFSLSSHRHSFIGFVCSCRVYVSHVDSSTLTLSISSQRPSFISHIFTSRFLDS